MREVIARSQTHAIIKYFNQFGGGPAAYPPLTPQRVSAVNNGTGDVTVGWAQVNAATPAALLSQAATGYRVYRSTDGRNFGNPVTVSGIGTTSANITGLIANQVYYFRVAAINGGGESAPSEALAVRVRNGLSPILIVNGYDRLDRFNDVSESEDETGPASPMRIPFRLSRPSSMPVKRGSI